MRSHRYTHTRMHTPTHTRARTHAHARAHTHTRAHTRTRERTHAHARAHRHTHARTQAHARAHTRTRALAHTHMHACTHTYTRIHAHTCYTHARTALDLAHSVQAWNIINTSTGFSLRKRMVLLAAERKLRIGHNRLIGVEGLHNFLSKSTTQTNSDHVHDASHSLRTRQDFSSDRLDMAESHQARLELAVTLVILVPGFSYLKILVPGLRWRNPLKTHWAILLAAF